MISSIADIENEWNGRLEQEDGEVLYEGRGRKKKKIVKCNERASVKSMKETNSRSI